MKAILRRMTWINMTGNILIRPIPGRFDLSTKLPASASLSNITLNDFYDGKDLKVNSIDTETLQFFAGEHAPILEQTRLCVGTIIKPGGIFAREVVEYFSAGDYTKVGEWYSQANRRFIEVYFREFLAILSFQGTGQSSIHMETNGTPNVFFICGSTGVYKDRMIKVVVSWSDGWIFRSILTNRDTYVSEKSKLFLPIFRN